MKRQFIQPEEIRPYDRIIFKGKRYGVIQVSWSGSNPKYLEVDVLSHLLFNGYLKHSIIPKSSVADGSYRTLGELDHTGHPLVRRLLVNTQSKNIYRYHWRETRLDK